MHQFNKDVAWERWWSKEVIVERFEKQINSAVKRCYFAVEPRVVFTTRQLLPPTKKKTCCLPIIAVILFTYLCATVIVGTLVARLNVFKNVSNNTSLNSPFQPAGKAFLVGVKPTILLDNFMSLLLVNIFLITLYVLLITMTTNLQFLLEVVLSFICPL